MSTTTTTTTIIPPAEPQPSAAIAAAVGGMATPHTVKQRIVGGSSDRQSHHSRLHRHHGMQQPSGPRTPLLAQPACYETTPVSITTDLAGLTLGKEFRRQQQQQLAAKQHRQHQQQDVAVATTTGRAVQSFEDRVTVALAQHNASLTQVLEGEFIQATATLSAQFEASLGATQQEFGLQLHDLEEQVEVCTDRFVRAETDNKALRRNVARMRAMASARMCEQRDRTAKRRAFDALQHLLW